MVEFQLGFANEETIKELSSIRNEPPWLLRNRLTALNNFNDLPIETHPLFTKYINVRAEATNEYIPYIEMVKSPIDIEDVPTNVSGIFHQNENSLRNLYLDSELKEKGVMLDTFHNFIKQYPEIIESWILGQDTISDRDKFSQMIKALFNTGVVIYVPDNQSITKPILLCWNVGKEKTAILARTIVVLGENSHATVIEEFESSNRNDEKQKALFSATTEVIVGEHSILKYQSVQNLNKNTILFLNRHANVGRDATLQWNLGHIGGDTIRSRIDNILRGRGASVKEIDALYGTCSQSFDMFSYTLHLAEDTNSDILSKGVLQDQSKAYTKGLVSIEKTGKGSDSYLGEFGMILSREARFLAIPSLEIENHLIKRAKHASSVAQIDDKQIFYMMTRGISEREARKLIVMGFLEPVVDKIPLEIVANRLRQLLESKWNE